jgi:hypothetical protein
MGIGVELYRQDQGAHGRFPLDAVQETNLTYRNVGRCLGGQDPAPAFQTRYARAKLRPLTAYVSAEASFRCPRDAGQRLPGCSLGCESSPGPQKPSNWATVGCSYHYNVGLQHLARGGFKQPCSGDIAGSSEEWVPNPSKYILIHEPPARLYACCCSGIAEWYQWHRRTQASDITAVKAAPALFFSPVLYVDGHAKMENFSKSLQTDPYFPYEETKDWIWYKAEERLQAKATLFPHDR